MKKFFGVLLAALVIAIGLWVALRVEQAHRQLTVAELLPKTTLLLAHAPDLGKTRQEWRASDLYAIWQEPTVQAWLQKPLAQFARNHRGRQTLEDFLQLGPQHCFLALTSLENNEPKLIGGFHFEKSAAEVRGFIEEREKPWLAKFGTIARETVTYQEHQIETIRSGRFVLASVYDRNWFFVANNLASLQLLLDRADRRGGKTANSLGENDAFRQAAKNLHGDFAGMFFFEPRPFLQKLMPLLAITGQSPLLSTQLQRLQRVSSVSGTLGFDQGKMREAVFVAIPREGPGQVLSRPSLATASSNTFFYSATLAHGLANWRLPSSSVVPALFRQLGEKLAEQGISEEDLRAAFGDELELMGEWPPETHWPTLVATIPVKDAVRARKIADALAAVELPAATWTRTEKDGATYYASSGLGGFVPITPMIAVSERIFIVGSDGAAVEAAMARKPPAVGELQKTAAFREATSRVPAAGSAFNYIDSRLLFERADAALRPLLLMSATIYPAWGNKIDVSKLPPTDAIAKHLSPIVMSQRYTGEGYLSESIGPVSFDEASVGLAGAAATLYVYLQKGLSAEGLLGSSPGLPSPTVGPIPTSTPAVSPP